MKLRPLLLSVAVLAPLAAATWWFQRPEPPPSLSDVRVGARLADPDTLARSARIRLTLPGGEAITFARAEGSRWAVEGSPALPADLSKLTRLSADLVGARVERLVTRNPDRVATLGLGETRVAYLDADGKTLLELQIGKNADGGGRFLRYGDESAAYLARLDLRLDATPAAWRDTLLLPGLAAADVSSLRIQFPDAGTSVTLTREKAGEPWTSSAAPEGQRVKQSFVPGQLTNLVGLRYTGTAPRLDPGVTAARVFPREIELKTFDDRSVTLHFQRLPAPPAAPEGQSPAPSAPRPVYVEIKDSVVDPLLGAAGRTHAFEVAEWIVNGLPAKPDDLFEAKPAEPKPTTE